MLNINFGYPSGHVQNDKRIPQRRPFSRRENERNLHENGQKPGWKPFYARVH